MPRGNGKGPMGMGPMTGRAAGFCAGYGVPGYANMGPGAGMGMGRGRVAGGWSGGAGRGWRNMFHATGLPGWMRFGAQAAPGAYPSSYAAPFQAPNPAAEKQTLRNQAQALQTQLDAIRQRLNEMETDVAES